MGDCTTLTRQAFHRLKVMAMGEQLPVNHCHNTNGVCQWSQKQDTPDVITYVRGIDYYGCVFFSE